MRHVPTLRREKPADVCEHMRIQEWDNLRKLVGLDKLPSSRLAAPDRLVPDMCIKLRSKVQVRQRRIHIVPLLLSSHNLHRHIHQHLRASVSVFPQVHCY